MNNLKTGWVITIFAAAHAIAAIACRAMNIDDGIALTILTMAMTVIICIRKHLNVEFTSVNVILVNIIGYLLGITIATVIGKRISYSPAIHAISTFITTELLGWGLLWFSSLFTNYGMEEKSYIAYNVQVKWLCIAVGAIFFMRIIIEAVLSTSLFEEDALIKSISSFASNTIVLLILISATILFIQYLHRGKRKFNTLDIFIAVFIFFILSSAVSAMMVGYGMPPGIKEPFTIQKFIELFIVAMINEAAIYSITFLVDYALAARRNMEMERAKANMANAQYINLKQQVNPHFLFNSLNALDCLVADNENDRARSYIQKLAGIYRYMLNNETSPLVSLKEEIEYANMYIELMKLRFQDGLKIETEIREEDYDKFVVTYSVQMLLENATKHNSISPDRPLKIHITSNGEQIIVKNNLSPKINPSSSTGLGLKYIHQNYIDHSGRDISIDKNDETYTVSLPLL